MTKKCCEKCKNKLWEQLFDEKCIIKNGIFNIATQIIDHTSNKVIGWGITEEVVISIYNPTITIMHINKDRK